MSNPWRTYEAARQERTPLDPLTIEGEEFIFPSSPSAEFGMNLMKIMKEHDGKLPDENSVDLIYDLLGQEQTERLVKLISIKELVAILEDLFRHYGFTEEEVQGETENPQEAPDSQKPSSSPGATSKPTSTLTTASS